MQKLFDYLSWGFLTAFFLPTALIVASWNSLPGESLYNVKRGLEQALLFFAKPSYAAQGTLHVTYTERRFAEAKKLLADRHSVQGLTYLKEQVATTKNVVSRAPNRRLQQDLAITYVATLREVAAELEQQKTEAGRSEPTTRKPTAASTSTLPARETPGQPGKPLVTLKPFPTPTPISIASATVPQPPVSQNVVAEIEETQGQIQQTIDDLQELVQSSSEPSAEENSQRGNRGEGRGQEERREHQGGERGGKGRGNQGQDQGNNQGD